MDGRSLPRSLAGSVCPHPHAYTHSSTSFRPPGIGPSAGRALSRDRTPCSLEEPRFLDRSCAFGGFLRELAWPWVAPWPGESARLNRGPGAWTGRWGCPGEGSLGWYLGNGPPVQTGGGGDDAGGQVLRTLQQEEEEAGDEGWPLTPVAAP